MAAVHVKGHSVLVISTARLPWPAGSEGHLRPWSRVPRWDNTAEVPSTQRSPDFPQQLIHVKVRSRESRISC
eukprot:1143273-Pelagomonas_calceolata.AAC.2